MAPPLSKIPRLVFNRTLTKNEIEVCRNTDTPGCTVDLLVEVIMALPLSCCALAS